MRIISEGVVRAPNFVVNVLAEFRSIGIIRVAHLEAENTVANKVNPFDDLGVVLVSGQVTRIDEVLERSGVHAKTIGEHDTTERISLFVSTVRIEL